MSRMPNGARGITIIQASVAITGIICATVALVLGAIDGAAYMALVGPVLGVSLGIGAYTSGAEKQTLRNGEIATLVASELRKLDTQRKA